MWSCKRCGTEVIEKKSQENLVDRDKNPYETKEIHYYQCPWCHSYSGEIEEIAEWEEE